MTPIERAMSAEITRALTRNATRLRPWMTRSEVARMLTAIADAGTEWSSSVPRETS